MAAEIDLRTGRMVQIAPRQQSQTEDPDEVLHLSNVCHTAQVPQIVCIDWTSQSPLVKPRDAMALRGTDSKIVAEAAIIVGFFI